MRLLVLLTSKLGLASDEVLLHTEARQLKIILG